MDDKLYLEYLAEGAANVVYRIRGPVNTDNNTEESFNYVLRLRKDRPHLKSAEDSVAEFKAHIIPLFNHSLLLIPELFTIHPNLMPKLNAELRAKEDDSNPHPRPKNRRGVYLPSTDVEKYGIILPSLAPLDKNRIFIEFKPKWLVQSPSAPEHARRCRNCALRDMRDSTGIIRGRGGRDFCPFDLLSDESRILKVALRQIFPREDHRKLDEFSVEFEEKVKPVLRQIQTLQLKYRSVGLADFDADHAELPLAMALRDCSVFMQISVEDQICIQVVKLADLDLKLTDSFKLHKWATTEREMIDGGWYQVQGTGSGTNMHCAFDQSSPLRPNPEN